MDSQTRQRKELGAFYTPSYLAKSLAQLAIEQFLITQINSQTHSQFASLKEIFETSNLLIIQKLNDILEEIKILDGSVGDGEFLKACLTTSKAIKEKINDVLGISKVTIGETLVRFLQTNLFGMEINSDAITPRHKLFGTAVSDYNLSSMEKVLSENISRKLSNIELS